MKLQKLNNPLLLAALALFALQMVGLLFLLIMPASVGAEDKTIYFTPQVTVPGSDTFKVEREFIEACKRLSGKDRTECLQAYSIKIDEKSRGTLLANYSYRKTNSDIFMV